MSAKNLTIKLTADQQKQIQEATGKRITELKIGLTGSSQLSEAELSGVAGGAVDFFLKLDGIDG